MIVVKATCWRLLENRNGRPQLRLSVLGGDGEYHPERIPLAPIPAYARRGRSRQPSSGYLDVLPKSHGRGSTGADQRRYGCQWCRNACTSKPAMGSSPKSWRLRLVAQYLIVSGSPQEGRQGRQPSSKERRPTLCVEADGGKKVIVRHAVRYRLSKCATCGSNQMLWPMEWQLLSKSRTHQDAKSKLRRIKKGSKPKVLIARLEPGNGPKKYSLSPRGGHRNGHP